jgi:cyclic dehypoxanthinyl futalosine synthase
MRYIKQHHPIHIHGFSPSEVVFFSQRFSLSVADVVRELRTAGLDSIPGGGGEILVDSVRERVARKKAQTEEWLGVQEEAHRPG